MVPNQPKDNPLKMKKLVPNASLKNYEKLFSLLIFVIAISTYTLTVEPTASYWDSGEFISAAYKLQIPHAPGAPLYTLTGRVFSLFVGDNTEQVAFAINMVSVISSSFTILFLFWSLIMILRKFVDKSTEGNRENAFLIFGSSAIGALAFAFSDSFWFSAVEAEVYALSSLFTAAVFWAILKWETIENESDSHKMLIFIAFLMGLSVGVHPLNLLAIPCLALVVYFNKKRASPSGILLTLAGSSILILLLMFVLRINLLNLATSIEIFAVNSLNLSFNSGAIIFLLTLKLAIGYTIWYSHKNHNVILNTIALSCAFILVGYSSYVVVSIRSSYNPPLNYSNPENLINMSSYLNMEDYGSRPLINGPYYYAEIIEQKKGNPTYKRGKDDYEVKKYNVENEYNEAQTTIFPRLYSDRTNHPRQYQNWLGLTNGELPTFKNNIEFFLSFQFVHMYFRYFMWNFSGRQGDVQDAGWLSLWNSFEKVPESIASNKARNNFLMLPLFLGIAGLLYSYKKNKPQFMVILCLFLITGLGLVVYLNSPPIEPRERDYIYVGSFFAFCIWISVGVLAIADFISRWKFTSKWALGLALVGGLSVPLMMATEGWDDHDRSGRYYSADSAKNFLATCEPNAILFTGGDNDTYPLWYAQEVEGYRTDVRVIVTTLYNVDWYINQLMQSNYKSAPLPLQLRKAHYEQGGLNDYIPVVENPNIKDQAININQYLKLVEENHPAIQIPTAMYGSLNTLPSKSIFLPIELNATLLDAVPNKIKEKISDKMVLSVKNNVLYKGDLLLLDLLANNNWERPIYISPGALQNLNIDLQGFLVNEGYAYRLLPIDNPDKKNPIVNTEVMYTNLMEVYEFRALDNKDVYYNDYYKNQLMQPRNSFNELAKAYINQQEFDKAKEVLERSIKIIPDDTIPYDITSLNTIELFLKAGEEKQATKMADIMVKRIDENLIYYLKSKGDTINEVRQNLGTLSYIGQIMQRTGQKQKAESYEEIFSRHYYRYEELM